MTTIEQVRAKVASQKTQFPLIYGGIDFDRDPERFTADAKDAIVPDRCPSGVQVTDEDLERIRAYTMLGDVVADAYAALMPKYGFRQLISMLQDACDLGVEKVADAPPELIAFIRTMEATPSWVDMDLVREGARLERNATAHLSPLAIRGAFIATFLNKYSALPMALTGTLSNESAARRVNETGTFFATTTLPGALERYGEGFKAAAMVRLMHSMVRFNAIRSGRWDAAVYGVPIPQVDQMPAGLIPVFLMAFKMLKEGRREFTAEERARVEVSRYRCFLLGLPEDLLADTPEGVVRMMSARNSTLRSGYDDATCGALVRATLSAYLPPDRSLPNRLHNLVERGFAKTFFLHEFLKGDRAVAKAIGVEVTKRDEAFFVLGLLAATVQMSAFKLADRIPGVRTMADKILVVRVRKLLKRYGHAEFTSDASKYKPTGVAAAA
ncbi:MAG: oxygenase MpaB family protein [Terricaulis sp.]